MESYAKEPVIDSIVGCNFYTAHGRTPKTRSLLGGPACLAGGRAHQIRCPAGGPPRYRHRRRGKRRFGDRRALCFVLVRGFPQEDWHHTCFVSELKTNYGLLIKVAHLVKTGCVIHSFYNSILGGYAGSAEGVAICSVAGILLECVVNMATTFSICPTHPFYNCDTAPELIWAASAAQQAVNRNTHLLTAVMTSPGLRPH